MAPQPPAPLQPMAVITTPLPALTEYAAPDGTTRTTPCDGVLIQIEHNNTPVISFFQGPSDAMDLAAQIATAAGKATRFNVGDQGTLPSLVTRLQQLRLKP